MYEFFEPYHTIWPSLSWCSLCPKDRKARWTFVEPDRESNGFFNRRTHVCNACKAMLERQLRAAKKEEQA